MIKFAAISPHPPVIVPTVGSPADLEKVQNTIKGMENLSMKFSEIKPETVILVSPHGPVGLNYFTFLSDSSLCGNFQMFGDFKTELCFKNDLDFLEKVKEKFTPENIPVRMVKIGELDHGSLVPLFFLSQNYRNFRLVSIAYSFLDREEHFKFGKMLQKISLNYQGDVAFVASGDLSHRLIPGAPAGFSPYGKEFDRKLIDLIRRKDVKGILNFDPKFVEKAGECGYRSIIILLGFLDGLNWEPEIISYEGPFGVGYLVVNFKLK